jgi:hypothetical protein
MIQEEKTLNELVGALDTAALAVLQHVEQEALQVPRLLLDAIRAVVKHTAVHLATVVPEVQPAVETVKAEVQTVVTEVESAVDEVPQG